MNGEHGKPCNRGPAERYNFVQSYVYVYRINALIGKRLLKLWSWQPKEPYYSVLRCYIYIYLKACILSKVFCIKLWLALGQDASSSNNVEDRKT